VSNYKRKKPKKHKQDDSLSRYFKDAGSNWPDRKYKVEYIGKDELAN